MRREQAEALVELLKDNVKNVEHLDLYIPEILTLYTLDEEWQGSWTKGEEPEYGVLVTCRYKGDIELSKWMLIREDHDEITRPGPGTEESADRKH